KLEPTFVERLETVRCLWKRSRWRSLQPAKQRSGGGLRAADPQGGDRQERRVLGSFMTWILFLLAHLSTVAYALVNRSDWGWRPASRSTPYAASPYWWSRIGHAGNTRSG